MLPIELVIVENEVPKTTSLLVAKFFGKRHSEVLRKIDLLDCSKEFSERNFASADYTDVKGENYEQAEEKARGIGIFVV